MNNRLDLVGKAQDEATCFGDVVLESSFEFVYIPVLQSVSPHNSPSSASFQSSLHRFSLSSGALEILKWLGMISMTIDHANRFFYFPPHYTAYCLGRLAMPLFAFVFAYNLARSNLSFPKAYFKSAKRLIFFGILATPAYMSMLHLHGLFPLNILFTFLVAILLFYSIEHPKGNFLLTLFFFIVGASIVDYEWAGLLICLSFWLWCKEYYFAALMLGALGFYLLSWINGNSWGYFSLLIIFLCGNFSFNIPRSPYFFWIYYPLHLSILALLAKIL